MEPSFSFSSGRLHANSEVRKVFDSDSGSRTYNREDTFTENMVAITSEAPFAAREAAFRALRVFRLPPPSLPERSLLPVPLALLAAKAVIAGERRDR
jgi:hypothetical protein